MGVPFPLAHDWDQSVEAEGGTALNDHLYLALKRLAARQGRRVVVILSDGQADYEIAQPDADTVVVTNYWGSLLRFDLQSGATLVRHIAKNGISALSRCGDHLVASSYDGALYLVDPISLETVNTLRSMTQRLHPSALI